MERIQHPYRATKLWNEILFAFRFGMPVKRHRRHMKVYDDCFTASEAVEWLQNFLQNNPNFGPHVTRSQTVQLLKKFYKSDVFEDVKKKRKAKRESQFTADQNLYRFLSISSPPKIVAQCTAARTPLAVLNSKHFQIGAYRQIQTSIDSQTQNLNSRFVPNPECSTRENNYPPVYNSFAILLWKKLVLRRVMSMLCVITLDDILDTTKINGQNIVHNMTKLDKNGVVAITDKSDEFPHWILSAMKCLASWPNASGSSSCLPNYPGFAIDVFQVVKDYFVNQGESLIPNHLFRLFCLILRSAFEQETTFNKKLCNCSTTLWRNGDTCIYETSTPITEEAVATISREISTASTSAPWSEISERESFNEVKRQENRSRYKRSKQNSKSRIRRSTSLPRLSSAAKPKTVSKNDLLSNSHEIHRSMPSDLESVDHIEKLTSSQYYRLESNNGFLSNASSSCHTASSQTLNSYSKENESNFYKWGFDSGGVSENSSSEDENQSDSEKFSHGPADLNLQRENCDFINDLANNCGAQNAFSEQLTVREVKPNVSRICQCQNVSNIKEFPNGDELRKSNKTELVRRLRVCTLLLKPPERRRLHLLLEFFQKMICNTKLDLHPSWPIKTLIVETFSSCILRDTDDDRVSSVLTNILIDHFEEIFAVPDDLKQDFQNIWRLHCERERMKYTADRKLTFCQQVSQKKYEEQKSSASRHALGQLLQDILTNPNLAEKQRQRKLNQFKENHPEVYVSEFPHDKEEQHKNEGKINLITRIKKLRL